MALAAPSAYAACGASVPLLHGFDSYFACDNSRGPVTAFAYLVSAPSATNTGPVGIIRDLGAGKVDIQTDWSTPGVIGCPQDALGNHRIMIVVQANDGTGLMTSISGASATLAFGYTVETSQQFLGFDDTGKVLAAPLPCGTSNGRPRIVSVSPSSVQIHVDPPHIFSDCDSGTVGEALGDACVDGFGGTVLPVGRIFTSNQPCGTRPDVRSSLWTVSTAVLDAAGNANVPYTKPDNGTKQCATDPTCLCAYIGTTTGTGTGESSSINGFISVAGTLAAQPTAENVRATTDSGKVKLSWSTSNEVGLAGFRLIAVSKTKGQFEIGSLIAANGAASSYTAEARMGDLKGSRSIIIRSVLTNGTTVDAAPVNF
jgi:hypothetical protein